MAVGARREATICLRRRDHRVLRRGSIIVLSWFLRRRIIGSVQHSYITFVGRQRNNGNGDDCTLRRKCFDADNDGSWFDIVRIV